MGKNARTKVTYYDVLGQLYSNTMYLNPIGRYKIKNDFFDKIIRKDIWKLYLFNLNVTIILIYNINLHV